MTQNHHVQTVNGEVIISKLRPNDRIADSCETCAERGRIIGPCTECLLYGGLGGSRRTCDSHKKRIYVIKCPLCGEKATFVELRSRRGELTGIGCYYCNSGSCKWYSGDDLIKPKGVI